MCKETKRSPQKLIDDKEQRLIDELGEKKEDITKALELVDDAPTWACELEKSSPKTLEILYRLFLRFMRRTIPSLAGDRAIKNVVSESINDIEFHAFASQFRHQVRPDFGESKLNNRHYHYPYTGETYRKITFEMLNPNQILKFLNIFKALTVPLDVLWAVDFLQGGHSVRIDSPETSTPFFFDKTRMDESIDFLKGYSINMPVAQRSTVKLGKIDGRKRYCPFRIVYTRDNDPHFPGGTICLDYSYVSTENGVLSGMPAEGYEIPDGKDGQVVYLTEEEAANKRAETNVTYGAELDKYNF